MATNELNVDINKVDSTTKMSVQPRFRSYYYPQNQTHHRTLEENHKDVHTRHGLLKMVSKRKRLLGYLKRSNQERHQLVVSVLGLRHS